MVSQIFQNPSLGTELTSAKCNLEDLSNLEVFKLIMSNMIAQGLLVTEYLSGGELFSRFFSLILSLERVSDVMWSDPLPLLVGYNSL